MACTRIALAAVLVATGLLLGPTLANGQLVLDGSLGPAGPVPFDGSEYHVTDDQGVFSAGGENRYHSFSQFDIVDPNQSAVFSAAPERVIERVIVRVTQPSQGGGSLINGGLRSTIPGADLFILNPFGIFFGPSATLDVNGSFFASSADVLRFPKGPGESNRDLPTGSLSRPEVLSAAAPTAFGFTGPSPAALSITGSNSLSVPEGETLSFVGGEVLVQSFGATNIRAPGATVALASASGASEILLAVSDVDAAALPDPPATCPGAGCVTLASLGSIDVSSSEDGSGAAGRIVIRGGRFQMLSDSSLTAIERGPAGRPTGSIDVETNGSIEIAEQSLVASGTESAADGPDVRLAAPLIYLEGGRVSSEAKGAGDGGSIEIDAQTLRVSNANRAALGAFLSTTTLLTSDGGGRGGDLRVRATDVDLAAGGHLLASTEGSGAAGVLAVAADTVQMSGVDIQPEQPVRLSGIAGQALEDARGRGSDVTITARVVEVENGAQISTATFGLGDSGNLAITASESVSIRGGSDGFAVVSSAARQPPGQGSASLGRGGSLTISAPSVILAEGGQATVSTDGTSTAGDLTIRASSVSLSGTDAIGNGSGLFARSNLQDSEGGDGGSITVFSTRDILVGRGGRVSVQTVGGGAAGAIQLDAGGTIRVVGGTVSATSSGSGAGGSVSVSADGGVSVTDGGSITAQSLSTGRAGDIHIAAGPRLEVVNASITTEALNASGGSIDIEARDAVVLSNAQITTSVQGGTGGGGDIAIDPEFVILDRSRIVAQAFEGAGGNIRIRAGTLLATPDSLIDASSQLGIDGNVSIDSPNPELTGKLAVLPQAFLNASELLADPCLARTATEGSFVVGAPRTAAPPDAVLAPESGAPAACAPPEETP